jgi:hypothetical protein
METMAAAITVADAKQNDIAFFVLNLSDLAISPKNGFGYLNCISKWEKPL